MQVKNCDFTWKPATGYPPLMVKFESILETDINDIGVFPDNIINYNWSFGDGTVSTEQNPIKTYNSSGNYVILLRVTFGNGQTVERTKRITIYTKEKIVDNISSISIQQQPLYVFKRLNSDDGYVGVDVRTYSGTAWNSSIPFSSYRLNTYSSSFHATIAISGSCLTGGTVLCAKDFNTDSAIAGGDLGKLFIFSPVYSGINSVSNWTSFYAGTWSSGFGCQMYYVVSSLTTNQSAVNDPDPPYVPDYYVLNRPLLNWSMFSNYTAHTNSILQTNQVFSGFMSCFSVTTGVSNTLINRNIIDGEWEVAVTKQNISTLNKSLLGATNYFDDNIDDVNNSLSLIYYDHQNMRNAEALYPGTIRISLPLVLWHGKNYRIKPNGNPSGGLALFDKADETMIDAKTGLRYRYLRTGPDKSYDIVGKVFYDKKIVVFTDQELIATCCVNSNRTWTYPPPVLGLSTYHGGSAYSGWVNTGIAYYATYRVRDQQNTNEVGSWYFGRDDNLHCRYIAGPISIPADDNNLYSLSLSIPKHVWWRKSYGLEGTGVSGVGYTCRFVDVMIATGTTDTVVPTKGSWKIIKSYDTCYSSTTGQILSANSQLFISYTGSTGGGGIYSGGSSYTLPNHISGSSESRYGSFGQEYMLIGYMSGAYQTTINKFVAFCTATNNEFNNTQNPTYTGGSTYISEVGLYNENNELLMIGKLSRPIPKDSTRFVTIKMELDF